MKKFIFVLVTLALTVPAWAAPVVDITCAQSPTGDEVIVSYNVSSYPADPNRVRAFALDITVDNGCTIETVECVQDYAHLGTTGYWVHPGSIVIEANGVISDYGTCAATALCQPTVTVEMGSLYAITAPAQSGELLRFTIRKTGCEAAFACNASCNVTVAENAIRGGVVMEDPSIAPTVNLSGCTAYFCSSCKGDMTGDGWVMIPDMAAIIGLMGAGNPIAPGAAIPNTHAAYKACGDMNGDGWLMIPDMAAIIGMVGPGNPVAPGVAQQCPASPCP
jgi:hypothetical protein